MPHIVVEHATGLPDLSPLLRDLHRTVATMPSIDPAAVKARLIPVTDYLTGAAADRTPFLHVTVSLLAGRPDELLGAMKDKLFETVQQHVSTPCSISVYVHEMPPARYRKS